MTQPIDRIPPLAAWTEDVSGIERRFTPFAHVSAPDPDQAGVRAMNAAAAREAVDIVGTWPRRLAIPAAALVSCAVTSALARLDLGASSPSLDGPVLAAVLGAAAGLATHALIRRRCIWRHRGYAARNALLTLGRCGACGFLLRGAIQRVDARDTTVALCQCGECGSLWPAIAAEHPRRSDTGERVDLPEVTGIDAARTRLRLRRALHALPSDFIRDDAGAPRYIAHMDGTHRRGASAYARDLIDHASALVMVLAVGMLLFPCAGGCLTGLVRALLLVDPKDLGAHALAAGVEVSLALAFVLAAVAEARRTLTQRHRLAQSRRFLRRGECACCTMPLPAADPDTGLATCTCCTASWRR